MWCHLSTGFRPLRLLRFVALSLLFIALITTLLFATNAHAASGTSKTLNFQGRLQTSTGAIVADGHYNMQFKIYQDGAGTAANNPGGTLKWTETYINNGGSTGVDVKNGLFSVNLGSISEFGTSVDWNQDTLYLSMNVAGSATACTTFGSGSCGADGEMLPMKRITAVPFALNADNANKLDGLTTSDLIQNTTSPQVANLAIQSAGATNVAALIQGTTSQTADILQVKTDGSATPALKVASNGSTTLQNATDSTSGFNIKVSDGGNLFTVDTVHSRVGINLGNDNTPTLNGQGLEVQGSLRLSGGGGTAADTYHTPIGSDVSTKINIPNYNPGQSGQIIAMGLPASADSTARVMSLFDARAGEHQPTLAVFSPNESQTLGLSWDGSNTNAKLKTSADSLSLQAGGQDLVTATKDGANGILYVGNGATSTAPASFSIQATTSTADTVNGGTLTVQGGGATTGNANGGDLILGGGTGSGTGTNGLVVLKTPTIQQVTDSCVGATSDCTVAATSLNNNGAITIGFDSGVSGKTAILPDPTNTTAGRLLYIIAAGDSSDFTLSVNGGGTGNQIAMRQNTATTLIWNGSDWIVAGGSSSATIQDSYNNTPQSAGGTELTLNNNANTGGLTIRDSSTNPVNNTLLEVKNSTASTLFSVNSTDSTKLASDGAVHDSGDFTTNWTAVGGAAASRITTDGQEASDSAKVVAGTAANNGVRNKLSADPTASTVYRASIYAKLSTGTAFTDFKVRYSPDGGTTFVDCTNYNGQIVKTTDWTQISCDIDTTGTIATDPYVYFVQPATAASARTFLVDNFTFTPAANSGQSVKVGTGSGTGTDQPTLFTVDKAASAPIAGDHDALLGSMYYDTTVGKLQCYEASGWGTCGASPDNFITLSPEYAGAVMNGTGTGVMTSDLCSDALNINDGSSSQPTVCGSNETYNFYNWTSSETTAQTKSIYVTYQLPSTFKEFAPGTASLMGRTDSSNSKVEYQIYRNNATTGLTPCGSPVAVSTGSQSSWQRAVAASTADPSTCGFVAGDSIVFRINLSADTSANAYVSNLGFTFSNN